jgi:hypothetical protein
MKAGSEVERDYWRADHCRKIHFQFQRLYVNTNSGRKPIDLPETLDINFLGDFGQIWPVTAPIDHIWLLDFGESYRPAQIQRITSVKCWKLD